MPKHLHHSIVFSPRLPSVWYQALRFFFALLGDPCLLHKNHRPPHPTNDTPIPGLCVQFTRTPDYAQARTSTSLCLIFDQARGRGARIHTTLSHAFSFLSIISSFTTNTLCTRYTYYSLSTNAPELGFVANTTSSNSSLVRPRYLGYPSRNLTLNSSTLFSETRLTVHPPHPAPVKRDP